MKIYKNSQADSILSKIKHGGMEKLHVVTDFNWTLTLGYDNHGTKQPSIITLLRQPGVLSSEYGKKAHELFDFYHPFEIDRDLNLEDKKIKMHKWWNSDQKLIASSSLTEEIIKGFK